MEFHFSEREDGQVEVDLGPDWPLLTEALSDSVSSLPPRGAPGNGPSTYWVDVALRGLAEAQHTGSNYPFAWGNSTLLRVSEGRVEARYDYDEEDVEGEFLETDTLRVLLERWRERIHESATRSTAPLPETYRRNPHAGTEV